MIIFFLKKHYLAYLAAVFVGLIYVIPYVFFIFSLGSAYKGIPMMQTANEDFYLARIQEILDGHPLLGSFAFFEYKNQTPLSPPMGELFYAIPSFVFKISPVNILIISRFFLPLILFFLVYYLTLKLTENADLLSAKINAIASALFVMLGYDLVDYRTVFNYLKGLDAPQNFLIWSRPVNPILGMVFLMSFLIFLWFIVQNQDKKRQKFYVSLASIFLFLMITNYFFSWGIAVSVLGALIFIYLIKKEHNMFLSLSAVIILGFLFSTPYWYESLKAKQNPWYHDSLLRSGLFYTHYPLFNKVVFVILGIYLISVFLPVIRQLKKEEDIFHFKNWHWFCFALILGSLWVYVQQVITGITIWPYHFVQYSIPLSIIVFMVLFYNFIKNKTPFLWKTGVFLIILISLFFGIYTQRSTYKQSYSYYSHIQSYAQLFDWINTQEKDCVILVKDQTEAYYNLNNLIPAFTHCNIYTSNQTASLMPTDRIYHNYLTYMALNGATSQNIDEYLKEHKKESQRNLASNWKELFDIKNFPDVLDTTEKRLKNLPDDYKIFFANDFKSELKKFRIDYIITYGKSSKKAEDLIKELNLVYVSNKFFVYEF